MKLCEQLLPELWEEQGRHDLSRFTHRSIWISRTWRYWACKTCGKQADRAVEAITMVVRYAGWVLYVNLNTKEWHQSLSPWLFVPGLTGDRDHMCRPRLWKQGWEKVLMSRKLILSLNFASLLWLALFYAMIEKLRMIVSPKQTATPHRLHFKSLFYVL